MRHVRFVQLFLWDAVTVVAVACSAATAVSAQSTASAAVSATIVAQPITITRNSNLNLGSIEQGTTSVIRSLTSSTIGVGWSPGVFDVTAQIGRQVFTTCQQQMDLQPVAPATGAPLLFRPSYQIRDGSFDTTAVCGVSYTVRDGSYQIFVGGELSIPADAAIGTYSGTLTLTVAY